MPAFNHSPDATKAQRLAEATGRKTWYCETQEEAYDIDPHPFKLTPPIVLVGRNENCTGENATCDRLSGTAAGLLERNMPKKYPAQFKNVLNFDTLDTDSVEETAPDRAARLRRQRQARRSEALKVIRQAAPAARIEALTKAFRLAYARKPLPIHFDVCFERNGVTKTERYTLSEAAFSSHLFRCEKAVGSVGSIKLAVNRSSAVEPAFVHRMRV